MSFVDAARQRRAACFRPFSLSLYAKTFLEMKTICSFTKRRRKTSEENEGARGREEVEFFFECFEVGVETCVRGHSRKKKQASKRKTKVK